MPRIISANLVLMLLSVAIVSCSTGYSIPTLPTTGDRLTESSGIPAKNLWGCWSVGIDPVSGTVDITPLRGVEFKANVTMFLQPPAGKTSNLGIKITDISHFQDEGLLDVEVKLTHPFPGLDQYTGFDVLGVFVNDGDTVSKYNNNLFIQYGNEVAKLLNADGYTRWFNPSEFTTSGILGFTTGALGSKGMKFTATANPYKYFCNGLGVNDDLTEFLHNPDNIDNRCFFGSTGSNKRLYKLQFPIIGNAPYLTFQYAVLASWDLPFEGPPYNIPDSWNISANQSEPFHLSIADMGSDLWYMGGMGGGTVRIRAELFDWQASTNPGGILGEFSKIVIESPNANIPGGYMEFTPDDFAPYIMDGTAVSSVAMLEIEGVTPVSSDDILFLVTVEGDAGTTYDQGFPQAAPDEQLAEYFKFSLPIVENNCGDFSVTGAIPVSALSGSIYPGFIVQGSNFKDGDNLAVDLMQNTTLIVSATNVAWISKTEITCDFDFTSVPEGEYSIRVTNGCDPVSYASMAYTIDPKAADPNKNIVLRHTVRDLSVSETDSKCYVLFEDGQLWIYQPLYADAATGTYEYTNNILDRICVQRTLNISGTIYTNVTAADTAGAPAYIYWVENKILNPAGSYAGTMIDVMGAHNNSRNYFVQNCGTYLGMIRRNINYPNSGFLSNYSGTGSGNGKVNMSIVKGVDTSRYDPAFPDPMTSYFYMLEGAPEYTVERLIYYGQSSNHHFAAAGTYLGGPGDGPNQLNDPKDIASDGQSRVFILDVKSTGQPVVKIYDRNMVYIGEVGDSITIAGTPLRIDTDDATGDVHVAHSGGVSIFLYAELPY